MAKETTYAAIRAREIGWTKEMNKVKVWLPGAATPVLCELLSQDLARHDNLAILYLKSEKRDGAYVAETCIATKIDAYTQNEVDVEVPFKVLRLKNPSPSRPKYQTPQGTTARPFLPPALIDKIEAKTRIKTLILTEGALKALCGSVHGLDVVGMNGIWGMRAKGEETLHPTIELILERCRPERLVYLHDGDCRQITGEYGKDLAQRPESFMRSVKAFRDATKLLLKKGVKVLYAHIKEDGPKGLDDLLLANRKDNGFLKVILAEFDGAAIASYLHMVPVHEAFPRMASLREYFHLESVGQFYDRHEDILAAEPFLFQGSWYRFNEDTEELDCQLSAAAAGYMLVGNRYYEQIWTLNSKGFAEPLREPRHQAIIIDDFRRKGIAAKDVEHHLRQIPKFATYANEPDFTAYKPVLEIKGTQRALNLAYPLEYEPHEGDISATMAFLEHVFANDGDSKLGVGLDMVQMYYTRPKQKQRILSLVSKENETGKTTFLLWLREIFGQNMSIVGNADFKSQFNGYVVKSLVGIDESRIDDPAVIEAIKSMVTSPYASLNEKNAPARQVVNHVKLIMTSNHVLDFAHVAREENKWFVIDVGRIPRRDSGLMDKLKGEIPAFLHFLRHRQLVHFTAESRFAISDRDAHTKALARVKENSVPQLVALVQDAVRQIFIDFPEHTRQHFRCDAKRLYELIFPERTPRYTPHDVGRVLKQEYELAPSEKTSAFLFPTIDPVAEVASEETGEVMQEASTKVSWKWMTGKVYTFRREQFAI